MEKRNIKHGEETEISNIKNMAHLAPALSSSRAKAAFFLFLSGIEFYPLLHSLFLPPIK